MSRTQWNSILNLITNGSARTPVVQFLPKSVSISLLQLKEVSAPLADPKLRSHVRKQTASAGVRAELEGTARHVRHALCATRDGARLHYPLQLFSALPHVLRDRFESAIGSARAAGPASWPADYTFFGLRFAVRPFHFQAADVKEGAAARKFSRSEPFWISVSCSASKSHNVSLSNSKKELSFIEF